MKHMPAMRLRIFFTAVRAVCPSVLFMLLIAAPAFAHGARPPVVVAYAGSMGAVMDHAFGPAFEKLHNVRYQGVGQGSYGLARLIAGRQLRADVFVAITPGPVEVLEKAGLAGRVRPVAGTRMVLVYSPKSRFADDFAAVEKGRASWHEVLSRRGLRLGRTDPEIDPQGANALFVLQLAERHYRQKGLLEKIAGTTHNPRQIFSETSLMSRLEAGQIDAAIGYLSAARSHRLPTVELPAEINLAELSAAAAGHARLEFDDGTVLEPRPLVFYAVVPANAARPGLGEAFVELLRSERGREIFRDHGYGLVTGEPP